MDPTLPFQRLGQYRVVERIGSGGMGDVYRGHDELLDRPVAIKVLPAELAAHEEFVRRFRREATAAARVNHPNVVPIHFIGQEGGNHFFVMQLIEGESLADRLARRGRLPPDEALDLFAQCLSGLGAAHAQGLIHRDIKPGNVLLDKKTGRAVLADFGLVRRIEQSTRMTLTGVVLGTVDYMAPEQARGQAIDPRADLYSLGVLFYQVLSGRLPYRADTPAAMMFQHAHQPPIPLEEAAPDVPPAVCRIVARLIAKDPADRYASCQEALADVRAARQGLPLGSLQPTVRRPTTLVLPPAEPQEEPAVPEGLEQWTSLGWWGRWYEWTIGRLDWLLVWEGRARQRLGQLQTTTQQVEAAVAEYERRCEERGRMLEEAQAVAAALARQIEETIAAAVAAREKAEWALGADEARIPRAQAEACDEDVAALRLQLEAQKGAIETLELDRSKAEAARARLRHQADLLSARLKAAAARRRRFGETPAAVRRRRWIAAMGVVGLAAAVVATGFWLIAWGIRGTRPALTEDDVAARFPPGEVQLLGRGSDALWALAVAADGQQVLAGTAGGRLVVREASEGKELALSGGTPAAAPVVPGRCEVAMTADGARAAFAGADGTVHLWDVAARKEAGTIDTAMGRVAGLAFSPDGSSLLAGGGSYWTGTSGEPLGVWDAGSGKRLRRLGPSGCRVDAVAWSPDGRRLLAAVDDWTIRLLDASTGTEIGSLAGHRGQVVRVKFLPDGQRAVSAGRDATIRLWDLPSGTALAVLVGHAAAVYDLAVSRDGRYVLSGSADGTIRLWALDRQREICVLQGHAEAVTGVAFLPDERFALSSSSDGTIRRWRVPVLTAETDD